MLVVMPVPRGPNQMHALRTTERLRCARGEEDSPGNRSEGSVTRPRVQISALPLTCVWKQKQPPNTGGLSSRRTHERREEREAGWWQL